MSYPEKGAKYAGQDTAARRYAEGGAVPTPRPRPHMDAARKHLRDEMRMEEDRKILDEFINRDRQANPPTPARPRFNSFGRDIEEEFERQRLRNMGQADT